MSRRRCPSSVCKLGQVKLCLFYLNLQPKPVKTFFVYKLRLSLASLYSVDFFVNKLKSNFEDLFLQNVLVTEEEFTTFLKKVPRNG